MVNEEGRLDQVDNDGSIWAFTPGDGVEIELVPDDGYEVYIADVTKAGENIWFTDMVTTESPCTYRMQGRTNYFSRYWIWRTRQTREKYPWYNFRLLRKDLHRAGRGRQREMGTRRGP